MVGVTSILLCPYWKKKYLRDTYRLYMGRKIHRMVEKELKKKGYETEVEVKYQLGRHEITGRIDAIDKNNLRVIEVKPIRSIAHNNYWDAQLGIYVEMMRAATNINWRGYFLLYRYSWKEDRVRMNMVRPMILYTSILSANAETVEELLEEYNDEIRIGGISCRKCPLRGRCRPQYIWLYNKGFWKLTRTIT